MSHEVESPKEKMRRLTLENQHGYSLVLVIAITGIVFAGLMGAMMSESNFNISIFKARDRQDIDFRNLMGEIAIVLGNKSSCNGQPDLLGKRVVTANPAANRTAINRLLYGGAAMTSTLLGNTGPGHQSQFGRLQLKSMEIQYIRPVNGNIHLVDLWVTASTPDTFGGFSFVRPMPMYVALDGSGNISSCMATVYSEDATVPPLDRKVLHEDLCESPRLYDFVQDKCVCPIPQVYNETDNTCT